MKTVFIFIIICTVIMLAGPPAHADKAEYFETYGYFTSAKGEIELELWNDFFSTARRKDSEEEHAGHLISVEYGITDRWMTEVYAQWRDNPAEHGLQYVETKLETRYRLGNYSPKTPNMACYAEYEKSAVAGVPDHLEGKWIVSKDFGKLNVSANAIFEKDLQTGSKWEFGYAGGLSYPLSKHVVASLETLVRPSDRQVFIIPGVHFPITRHDWCGVGVSFETSPAPFNATLRTFFAHEF
jgi:hypothetical protein